MNTKSKFFMLLFLFALVAIGNAQTLNFQECVNSAYQNNIQLKIQEINVQHVQNALKTAKWSYLPSINAQIGQSFDVGRTPTNSAVIINENSTSTAFGASVSVPIFSGTRNYYQIKTEKINLQAENENLNQAKEVLLLNITGQYLQVLLHKELYNSALKQKETAQSILDKTQELTDAGALPVSDLYEAKANLAKDELLAVQALQNVRISLLDLAQLIDLKDILTFDIVSLLVDENYIRQLETENPKAADIYQLFALRPAVKAQELSLKSSETTVKLAKSGYIPTLSFNYNYSNSYYKMFNMPNDPVGDQFRNNNRNNFYFSLNIPIFNRHDVIGQVKSAKLNVLRQELELENTKKVFVKEVQQAHLNAETAKTRFEAAQKGLESATLAYEFTQKRYDAGKGTIFELNESKNRKNQTEFEMLQAQYEYIFRCKILDFYYGNDIRF
jgi:outer membrane protein